MKYLPIRLAKILPKLNVIVIERSNLTSLMAKDFEGFTELKTVVVRHNNLTSVEAGVFDDALQIG